MLGPPSMLELVEFEMSIRIIVQIEGSFGADSRAENIDKDAKAGEADSGYTDWCSCRIDCA